MFMLSVKKPKNKKRLPLLLALGCLVALAIIGVVIFTFTRPSNKTETDAATAPSNTINYDGPTANEQAAGDSQKIAQQDTSTTSTGQADLLATITRADQASAGQPLNIRAFVDGTTSGQCQVTLTKSGKPTIQKTFSIAVEGTSSMCQNADIAASEFAVSGDWNLSLIILANSSQSKPVEQTVTIEL